MSYASVGQIAIPTQLSDMLLQTTTVGGLLAVQPAVVGPAVMALQKLGGFVADAGSAPDPLMGAVGLGPTGDWIDKAVAAGKAVLIDVKGLSAGGAVKAAITGDPATLAGMAQPQVGFAVLASDQQLFGQAQGLAAAPKCPSGQFFSSAHNKCVDPTAPATADAGVPVWMIAAAIAGAGLLVVGVRASARRSRRRAA